MSDLHEHDHVEHDGLFTLYLHNTPFYFSIYVMLTFSIMAIFNAFTI